MDNLFKIKQLRELLAADGYAVTERQIKYYIDIGILPEPDYPKPNQALYSRKHYIRLKNICSMKESGLAFTEIKEVLLEKTVRLQEGAKKEGIDFTVFCKLQGVFEQEMADISRRELELQECAFTKEELLRQCECHESYLDIGVDTGLIQNKNSYDRFDVLLLTCIKNLIEIKKLESEKSGNLIERIGELSDVHAITAQIVNLLSKEKEKTWLYTYLIEAALASKSHASQLKEFDMDILSKNKKER